MQQLQAQETRRQAMLQVMGMEVWLPRQQLPHAAPTPDWLLDWQPEGEEPAEAARPANQPAATPSAKAPAPSAAPAAGGSQQARASLQQVRQALAGEQAVKPVPVAAEVTPQAAENTAETPNDVPEQLEQVEIPRFSLQLLRSGPCLLLADLPLGEAFQTSDPDFQLLLDILRAARLPQPKLLRRGEPIRWPLLTSGALANTQDASAARVCVRDLLEHEYSQQPASFVWLLGPRAMRFANAQDEDADLFALTPLRDGVRLWNLPSLEQLMQERALKPQLWQQMQKLMPHWTGHV